MSRLQLIIDLHVIHLIILLILTVFAFTVYQYVIWEDFKFQTNITLISLSLILCNLNFKCLVWLTMWSHWLHKFYISVISFWEIIWVCFRIDRCVFLWLENCYVYNLLADNHFVCLNFFIFVPPVKPRTGK